MLRRIPTTCATKFHSDLRLSAAPRRYYAIPRRAPSTRRAIARQNAQSGKGGAAIDSSTSLPSLSLLTEARASGVLSIEPGHALRFLEAYVALGREVDASRVKTLCAGVLSILSYSMQRCCETDSEERAPTDVDARGKFRP